MGVPGPRSQVPSRHFGVPGPGSRVPGPRDVLGDGSHFFDIPELWYPRIMSVKFLINTKAATCRCFHSHKKWKDSLEGNLDRVLFAAELEFPKILVPRLPQHTSNGNIVCAGKSEWSKQLYSLYVTNF